MCELRVRGNQIRVRGSLCACVVHTAAPPRRRDVRAARWFIQYSLKQNTNPPSKVPTDSGSESLLLVSRQKNNREVPEQGHIHCPNHEITMIQVMCSQWSHMSCSFKICVMLKQYSARSHCPVTTSETMRQPIAIFGSWNMKQSSKLIYVALRSYIRAARYCVAFVQKRGKCIVTSGYWRASIFIFIIHVGH